MVRAINSPAASAPAKIPQVSFVRVQDESSARSFGTHDLQARSYGYNDFSEFRRPEHYIRHVEPLESELAVQVEYDADEQDREWLDALNAERRKEQLNHVTYETFEVIMDRLEKEWFDLTKNVPKPDFAMPSEDSTCAICDDSEGENCNAIVFCDGCNLAVHQDCYGVPYIPEGQWLCRKCTVSPEIPVSCILCPNEGGAFKQTITGEWVHLLCAIWVPETRVANEVFMEPITGVDRVSKQRWKLKCSICDIREGACIQCAKTSCFLAFHATCARKQKLLMPMKSFQGAEPVALTCFCEKHLPSEQQQMRTVALESGQFKGDVEGSPKLSKSARAYAKTYKPGPPLVPIILVKRIMHYIAKVVIRKKEEFVLLLCKYWSLKREARRGAPLLKRLHLEPWTASAGAHQQTELDRALKLEHLQRLRQDLNKVLALTELSRKREARKLVQAEIVKGILSRYLFAPESTLRFAFERIMAFDRQDFFRHPVSKADVPDYFDIVKNPMCWSVIDGKLDHHGYWDVQSFKNDVQLVLDNAILYNKSDTAFYKAALRIKTASKSIVDELDTLAHSPISLQVADVDDSMTSHATGGVPVGDLEPPLDMLDMLITAPLVQSEPDLQHRLDVDPLTSLFSLELGKVIEPPLKTSAPQPKPHKRKGKATGFKRASDVLDSAPGFRAPRTRQALAEAAAFEAEATSVPSPGSKKGTRWKRAPMTLPGRSEVPPMVDDVDNQKSFKMFDAGWILPPDQKRRGRPPLDKSTPPVPRKRTKTGPSASQLATFSTDAAENETLQTASGSPVQHNQGDRTNVQSQAELRSQEAIGASIYVSDGDLPPQAGPASFQQALGPDTLPISAVRHESDGTVIIETLDTPSTRRAKYRLLKGHQLVSTSTRSPTAPRFRPPLPAAPIAGPSRLPDADADVDMESELSSLTGFGTESIDEERALEQSLALGNHDSLGDDAGAGESDENTKKGRIDTKQDIRPSQLPKGFAPDTSPIDNHPHEQLEGGTLVWAKSDTYPWWPAVIFEEDDENIPDAVLERKAKRKCTAGPLQLVRFYDKRSSWQWVTPDKLLMLGIKELDEELLSTNSTRQKWKNAALRRDCREAWRLACAEMETDGDAIDRGEGAPDETQNDSRETVEES